MNTVEIVRTVVGIICILFGLGVYVYDKLHEMKYSEFRYSPISWLICLLAGVCAISYNVKIGIVCAIVTLILWGITKIMILNVIKKKSI